MLIQKELTTEKQFRIMISKHPEKPENIREIVMGCERNPEIQKQAAIFPEAAQHTKNTVWSVNENLIIREM